MASVGQIDDQEVVEAGAAGTLQAVFPAPAGAGTLAVVAVNVPNAEAAASWGAFFGPVPGRLVASWGGNSPCSALRQPASQSLTVTGTGLIPGKSYIINRIGYAVDQADVLLLPLPPPPGGAAVVPPVTPVPGGSSSGGGSGPPAPPTPPPPPVIVVNFPQPTAITSILTLNIAMTGSAVNFVNFPLQVGLIVLADIFNVGPINVGGATGGPDPVSVNSFKLQPGEGISFPIANADILAALGTAGDILSLWGS